MGNIEIIKLLAVALGILFFLFIIACWELTKLRKSVAKYHWKIGNIFEAYKYSADQPCNHIKKAMIDLEKEVKYLKYVRHGPYSGKEMWRGKC